jgi:flagellar biosynthetic protein FliQ
MSPQQVVQIGRELLLTALLLALPTIAVSLVVGLVISLLQTLTSIQEQTLNFAPRIVAVGLVIALTMPWTLQVLVQFTFRMFWHLAEAGQ